MADLGAGGGFEFCHSPTCKLITGRFVCIAGLAIKLASLKQLTSTMFKRFIHTHTYIYISIIETFGLSCGSPCKVGLLAGG